MFIATSTSDCGGGRTGGSLQNRNSVLSLLCVWSHVMCSESPPQSLCAESTCLPLVCSSLFAHCVELYTRAKNIANIKSRKKKVLMSPLRNEDESEASRKGIAITFAKFYSHLHSEEKHEEDKEHDDEEAVQKGDDAGKNEEPIGKKETILKKWTKARVGKTQAKTFLNSPNKNCKTATASKEEKLETPRESKPKTSQDVTTRRRKCRETSSTGP